MICWICNNCEASSKEHIIKKSDIKRAYGQGSYKGGSAPVHVKNGAMNHVQGADSKLLKYKESLCHHCNNTFTQPFDRAYDTFVDFVYNNSDEIVRKRFIDFSEVYGERFEEGQLDLYKYLAKSFGCRLADAGESVSNDVRELLYKRNFQTGLRISFAVNEDVLILPSEHGNSFIGKGDLLAWPDANDKSINNSYQWSEHVSWLFIWYWYNSHPDGSLGSTWVADNQFVYLGCSKPLDCEERERFKIKIKEMLSE